MGNETEKPQGLIDPTNQGPVNPAKYFAEWKSTEESFIYYDKTTKKNVVLPMPFTFIPLARAVCIKGYNEPEKTSYWSNEVENPKTDPFTVVGKNNLTKKSRVAFVGLWEEISKAVKAEECSWTESIYGAAKDSKGKLQIINVQLNGSGITHWFEFLKANKIWGSAVTVKEFSNEKKGSNKYKAPIFSLMKIGEKSNLEAASLQKEVLDFLKDYYAANAKKNSSVAAPLSAEKEPPFQDTRKGNTAKSKVEIEDDGSTDIVDNMDIPEDDIPF